VSDPLTKEERAAKLLGEYLVDITLAQKAQAFELEKRVNAIAPISEMDLIELRRAIHDVIERRGDELREIKEAVHQSADAFIEELTRGGG
jgi:hypothetical protein